MDVLDYQANCKKGANRKRSCRNTDQSRLDWIQSLWTSFGSLFNFIESCRFTEFILKSGLTRSLHFHEMDNKSETPDRSCLNSCTQKRRKGSEKKNMCGDTLWEPGTKVVTQSEWEREGQRETHTLSIGVAIAHGNGKDVRRDTVDHWSVSVACNVGAYSVRSVDGVRGSGTDRALDRPYRQDWRESLACRSRIVWVTQSCRTQSASWQRLVRTAARQ